MYKDRGIIKWAPFDALVGFNDLIKEMLNNKNKIEKPILNEDRLEKMDRIIKYAINKNLELEITYYETGFIKIIYDYIKKIDIYNRNVLLQSNFLIKIDDIINLNI